MSDCPRTRGVAPPFAFARFDEGVFLVDAFMTLIAAASLCFPVSIPRPDTLDALITARERALAL